jgi:uncharacterized protein YciW
VIALRDNYPLVRFQDGSVMNYDRAWLASAVVRAADVDRSHRVRQIREPESEVAPLVFAPRRVHRGTHRRAAALDAAAFVAKSPTANVINSCGPQAKIPDPTNIPVIAHTSPYSAKPATRGTR